ncbi:MAG TPA: PQQ-binding-like beta-propeller repeat protein, partial [Burkholderiaceae bacterium]|nr:PQQ-binding-like beta-propeller repeat protein [Burkholderiaceae bacterium]
ANGALLWQVKAGDPKAREYFAAAPLVWQGRLYLGVAGSDWGIRGRVMAFDTRDGRELWRFNTIPMGRETGARSWRNPASARTGGGGTWSSYALDPATGELFVSVANPAPDFLPSRRPGDNLFTNSLVVLDARDGRLEWWHQVGRNDSHDWDLAAAPMLYSTRDGQARVALGSKDGHVYAVDRRTRRRVFQTAVTRIENSAAVPTPQGVHVCPGGQAGVHWNGPAFDAARAQLLVGSVDACGTFKSDPAAKRTLGMGYNGGAFTADPQAPLGRVTALDAATGTTRWRFDSPVPIVAGVTPTAGGLVFTGDLAGDLIALNSDDGRLLGRWASGGAIAGGVISYRVGAAQYVATTSGNISRLSFKSTGSPKIVVFALGDGSPAAAPRVVEVAPAPAGGRADGPVDINWGKLLYASHCAACHGARGEGGGAAPALTGLAQRRSYADTVAFIKDPKAPMPRQFPAPLSAEEVDDIATFIRAF